MAVTASGGAAPLRTLSLATLLDSLASLCTRTGSGARLSPFQPLHHPLPPLPLLQGPPLDVLAETISVVVKGFQDPVIAVTSVIHAFHAASTTLNVFLDKSVTAGADFLEPIG